MVMMVMSKNKQKKITDSFIHVLLFIKRYQSKYRSFYIINLSMIYAVFLFGFVDLPMKTINLWQFLMDIDDILFDIRLYHPALNNNDNNNKEE
ncbi:hypothetical protein DERP_002135 [Dermatophagoides pteronyssinus]|uniref:Uncharacterized protein n=1 Tax=Dermatophagoides pteronyssinus TaxID=6956 RepID=A0ABQ8JHG4_DERPT|nr:hypothetical protein DERP_002135 [Dermatophagoides pteronyssinus]